MSEWAIPEIGKTMPFVIIMTAKLTKALQKNLLVTNMSQVDM